jgi:hypothetical protein
LAQLPVGLLINFNVTMLKTGIRRLTLKGEVQEDWKIRKEIA